MDRTESLLLGEPRVVSKEKVMWRKSYKKASIGKVFIGILVGGAVGATVGWLTAPAADDDIRRRFHRNTMSARERAKTAAGNIESKARDLAETVSNDHVETIRKPSTI